MTRGVYRGIYSALPDEEDFQRLHPHSKLVLYTLRVCHDAGPACIFVCYPELVARRTGLTVRQVESAMLELERDCWIMRERFVLWVRNALRYDPYTSLANENHRTQVLRWIAGLPRLQIVLSFCDYYSLPYPFEAPAEGIAMGFESKEKDSEKDSEKEKENTGGDRAAARSAPPPAEEARAASGSSADPVTKNGLAIPPKVLEKIPDLRRWPEPEALAALWNHHAQQIGLPLVQTLSVGRRQRAVARLRQLPDWRWWNGALSKITSSRFLTGGVPASNGHSQPFRAHFDWLLATKDGTENVVALHDGRYDR